jgi:hypothetical protein
LPGEELSADRRLEQRQQSAMALAAIANLPDRLREPAALFFVHECSQSSSICQWRRLTTACMLPVQN